MANDHFSQDPFEERKEAFEEWKGEESAEENSSKPTLERKALLGGSDKKKNLGMLGLFVLLLAVGAFLIFSNGKKKEQEGIIQEAEEFTPAPKRPVAIPEAPPAPAEPIQRPPSEDEIRKAQEAEALRQARLKSAIVVYQGGAPVGSGAAGTSAESAEAAPSAARAAGKQDPNRQFQEANSGISAPKAQASALGNMGNIILQGKLIDAVLETGVNSDLPGMVRAIVSYDVYGEAGNKVLIPRGSRLIGQYNSAIRKGQARVFVIWNRLVRPDGIEVALDSGGTDQLGVAGIKGKVNNHFFQIFGASFLLSIIGASSATVGVDTNDQYNSLATYRQEVANGFQDSASGVLEQYASIPPTITIKQGSLIKVFVARDLDFSEALLALYPAHKMIVVP